MTGHLHIRLGTPPLSPCSSPIDSLYPPQMQPQAVLRAIDHMVVFGADIAATNARGSPALFGLSPSTSHGPSAIDKSHVCPTRRRGETDTDGDGKVMHARVRRRPCRRTVKGGESNYRTTAQWVHTAEVRRAIKGRTRAPLRRAASCCPTRSSLAFAFALLCHILNTSCYCYCKRCTLQVYCVP